MAPATKVLSVLVSVSLKKAPEAAKTVVEMAAMVMKLRMRRFMLGVRND